MAPLAAYAGSLGMGTPSLRPPASGKGQALCGKRTGTFGLSYLLYPAKPAGSAGSKPIFEIGRVCLAGPARRGPSVNCRGPIVDALWSRIVCLVAVAAGIAVCAAGQADDVHLDLPRLEAAALEPADSPPPAPEPWASESLERPEAISDADLQQRIDQAVEARLAGIPRPRYIPATDLVPPRGLSLYADKQGRRQAGSRALRSRARGLHAASVV
jgi:hypothetical protein